MTEQPISGKEQYKLTTEPPTNRLNDRGDIFMSIQPGNVEQKVPSAHERAAAKGWAVLKGGREQQPVQSSPSVSEQPVIPPTQDDLVAAWRGFGEKFMGAPVEVIGAFDSVAAEKIAQGEMPPQVDQAAPAGPAKPTGRGRAGGPGSPGGPGGPGRSGGTGGPDDPGGPDDGDGGGPHRPPPEEARRGKSLDFYFEAEDREQLEENPLIWLDTKLDTLYQVIEEGQELSSPLISQYQNLFGMGANYLSLYAGREGMPTAKTVKEFITAFNTRLSLIAMRSSLEHGSWESAKQSAERLGSNGLLRALSMEDGKVSEMSARMEEVLESQRLRAFRGHITPEMMSDLQGNLINEQVNLAGTGTGYYGKIYETELAEVMARAIAPGMTEDEVKAAEVIADKQARALVEPKITRAVKAAYDVFVITQRQATIVARGEPLSGVDAFQSEPAAIFNMFNLEALLTEKFTLYGPQAKAFLKEMKLEIARAKLPNRGAGYSEEELEDYGKRMLRDLFAAPGFFDSGWRIDHITKKIHEYVDEKNSGKGTGEQVDEDDLALFARLKRNESNPDGSSTRPEVWGRIAEVRPEEIVRLYRERVVIDPRTEKEIPDLRTDEEKRLGKLDLRTEEQKAKGKTDSRTEEQKRLERQLDEFFADSSFDGYRAYKTYPTGKPIYELDNKGKPVGDSAGKPIRVIDSLATYDKFKDDFGAILQLVRQNAYSKDFRAIRIGETGSRGLSATDQELIVKYFGGGDAGLARVTQLQKMFKHLTAVATDGLPTVKVYKEGDILPGGEKIKKYDFRIGKAKEGHGVIHELLDFNTFEDIYTRVLLVDDVLLSTLEAGSDKVTPLSKSWKPASEVTQDPLVRNMRDLEHFSNAAQQLVTFISNEDTKTRLEAAMKFAQEAGAYNGLGDRGKSDCIRYTAGVLLELSKIPIVWDALGIGKLPFRKAMTSIERIYGPQAETMSRGDLRKQLDYYRSVLTPEAYQELEHLYEVTGKDTTKLRAISLLFFLTFSVFVEGYEILDIKGLEKGLK